MDYDADLRRRTLFAAVGTVLFAVVLVVLFRFRATLVFTIFLYYASRPIYRNLDKAPLPQRIQQRHLPYHRQLRAITTIGLFLLPFLFLFGYTLVLVLPEAQRFFGGDGPGAAYLSALQGTQGNGLPEPIAGLRLSDLLSMSPDEVVGLLNDLSVQMWLEQAVSGLFDSASLVATAVLHGFILLAGTYYLLTDGSRLVGWFLDTFDNTGILKRYATAVDDELSSILFGNILNALVTGIIGVLVFLSYNLIAPGIVSVPFPPFVGALTGVGSLIPVVGMKIVYLPVGVILAVAAIAAGEPSALGFVVLFLLLTFVVVDTIPDFLIRPYVSGKRTHIGLLMFAYILGPITFGFYGIFLAPVLLVLVAQFFRIVTPYVLSGETTGQQTTFETFGETTSSESEREK
ncbi:AI-2E family transporter [Halorubrum sp. Atlit-26R]|uniref:AI-2E family transporter n=1 Tax=Halorubrum sp. Atlit-26R TaxID=2282128 RepID=UPI000EF254B7|nr:AI-2E family transporter [Halorubrum sp. Atlit-26R]RLM62634.1 AI-2E family transporter [Halorubrum sp. Atlit-26R]